MLNVLERKGVVTKAEVLEESARLGKKSMTGR